MACSCPDLEGWGLSELCVLTLGACQVIPGGRSLLLSLTQPLSQHITTQQLLLFPCSSWSNVVLWELGSYESAEDRWRLTLASQTYWVKKKETDVKYGIINLFSLIQQSFTECLFCSEDCGSFRYSLMSEIITKGIIFTSFLPESIYAVLPTLDNKLDHSCLIFTLLLFVGEPPKAKCMH